MSTRNESTAFEPLRRFEIEQRSAMALLRLIASAGLAVVVLGVALRLAA